MNSPEFWAVRTGGELTVDQLGTCAEAAADGMTSLAHAKPGDKTIVDAITPAVVALRGAGIARTSVADAICSAVAAAHVGAESTADMIATLGGAAGLASEAEARWTRE